MYAYRFKDSIGLTIIGSRYQTGAPHQTCTHVAYNVPVQIRHHHHIKLLRFGHQLRTESCVRIYI